MSSESTDGGATIPAEPAASETDTRRSGWRRAGLDKGDSPWWPSLLGGLLGGLIIVLLAAWYEAGRPEVPPALEARLESLDQARGRLESLTEAERATLAEAARILRTVISE